MARRLTALLGAIAVGAAGCGGGSQPAVDIPRPASPLPTAGLAGDAVPVYPLTLLSAERSLGWEEALTPRPAALERADSVIGALLQARSPEVSWVLPPALRRSAARAPGVLVDPDQLATALLRAPDLTRLPDPLRSQMRALNAVAGGRYALVPASLVFVQVPDGGGRAELTLVIADVRTGQIGWRTMAHAVAADPWTALDEALRTLTPGLP